MDEADTLIDGFKERVDEVDAYMSFLTSLQIASRNGPPRFRDADAAISPKQQQILFSTVYLLLYNLVEASITSCLDALARAAVSSKAPASQLTDAMRREWVRAMASTHQLDLTAEHRLERTLVLCDELIAVKPLQDFEIGRGGGGNWDDVSIHALGKRIGIDVSVSADVYRAVKKPIREELGAMTLVKTFRNRLAHGGISFSQCAEGETVADLLELKRRTISYVEEIVACFCRDMKSFSYLRPAARPA